jgi:hypothetical protein
MSEIQDSNPDEPSFIEDGHTVTIVWDKDHIRISHVDCPNTGQTSICNRRRTYCVVQRFVETFGFDLNVGRTVVRSPIEIAWVGVIGASDLDEEFATIWILPMDDPEYRSWKDIRSSDSPLPDEE